MFLLNNVKWVTLSQIVKVLSQISGVFIFSRYLTPSEIGLMSMALLVINFTNMIRDLGSSAAIIQQEKLTENLKQAVFSLNSVFGVVLFLLVVSLSSFISSFFSQEKLKYMLIVLAITFPINSVTSIHLALLERDSSFFKIAKVEVISSLTSLLFAIILSINGVGVYSLVFQTLLYSILSATGFWYFSQWRAKFNFSIFELKKIFSFTSNLVLFNLVNYFSRNTDQIIIGRFFGASILGQYSLAYRIMLFPIQNITFVLTRSLYPILSRFQNDKKESLSVYLKTLFAISIITPPLMIGLAFVSADFVSVFLGNNWGFVAKIIIWLAPVAILQSFVSTTGSVFMASGKTNVLLIISLYNFVLQITSFIAGAFFDVYTLVQFYLVANILMFIPNMYLALRMLSGRISLFIFKCVRPLTASLLMLLCLTIVKNSGILELLMDYQRLTINIIIGALVYSVLIYIFEMKYINKFLRDKRNRKKGGDLFL